MHRNILKSGIIIISHKYVNGSVHNEYVCMCKTEIVDYMTMNIKNFVSDILSHNRILDIRNAIRSTQMLLMNLFLILCCCAFN